jgi:hypothetical protein
VHDIAVVRIAAEQVGDDLTEGAGEEPFVYRADGPVHIFLGGGNAASFIQGIAQEIAALG